MNNHGKITSIKETHWWIYAKTVASSPVISLNQKFLGQLKKIFHHLKEIIVYHNIRTLQSFSRILKTETHDGKDINLWNSCNNEQHA